MVQQRPSVVERETSSICMLASFSHTARGVSPGAAAASASGSRSGHRHVGFHAMLQPRIDWADAPLAVQTREGGLALRPLQVTITIQRGISRVPSWSLPGTPTLTYPKARLASFWSRSAAQQCVALRQALAPAAQLAPEARPFLAPEGDLFGCRPSVLTSTSLSPCG